MATKPDRISYNVPASGNYTTTTSPKTTNTFNVTSGDILVVIGSTEDSGSSLNTPTASGGSVTWTLRQSISVANYSSAYLWTGVVGATATGITVSVTRSGTNTHFWGFSATVWRNHGGVGVSAKANASGAPSLTLTGCSANSGLQVGINDWNAVNGSSRVWRSVNGTAATESLYSFTSGRHTCYGGFHPDSGAAGNPVVGLTAPTGQKYSIVGIEILGTTASTTPVSNSVSTTWDTLAAAAQSRSTSWDTDAQVAQSRATTWTVRTPQSASRATTWATLAQQSAARSTTWVTRAIVSAARATTWEVFGLAAVAASRATSWVTRAQTAGSRSTSWATLLSVAQSRSTSWVTRLLLQTSRASSWTVYQQVASSRASSWVTRTAVSSARSSTWAVLQAVAAARATSWNTLGTNAFVSASRATTWVTRAVVTGSRSTTWSSLARVLSNPRAASWAVLVGVQRSVSTTWVTRQLVTASRSALWQVVARVSAARSALWDVLRTVTASRSTSWATQGSQYGTGTIRAGLGSRIVGLALGQRQIRHGPQGRRLSGDLGERQTSASIEREEP